MGNTKNLSKYIFGFRNRRVLFVGIGFSRPFFGDMAKLKKLMVKFISLVESPANRRGIVWKSRGEVLIPILKVNEEQRMVYGIVYAPDDEDTDGDWADREEIKRAAYEFMKSGRIRNVDQGHDFEPDEGFIAESWLIRKGDPLFPEESDGAWAVGIYVENDETWERVKKGELNGLSLAGYAVRSDEELKKKGKSMFGKFKDFVKGVRENYQGRKLNDLTWALVDSLEKVLGNEEIEDKRGAIEENVKEYLSLLNEVMAVNKAGRVLSKKNFEKIQSAYKALEELINLVSEEKKAMEKEVEKNKENPQENQAEPLTKDDLEKERGLILEAVKKEVGELLKPITERLEKLEKTPLGKMSLDVEGDEDEKRTVWI